jgi:acetylornithine deacetylase/succinyl-diaminopimelate desuccinylase-like protein
MAHAAAQSEAADLLGRLIRFNTVNPPGAERDAQEFLRAQLEESGFQCELLGSSPERPNLVARLDAPDGAPGPTLCLLSHVDTVLANPAEWSRDPWSGELAEGYVWGRGALDMKSQTAAEVVAASHLARGGWRPERGALLVVVVVDEETGGGEGAQWITRNHPDKVRCDLLLNEGGGALINYGGRRLISLGCAEKGVFRFALRTSGAAAHASMPRLGDNALLKMAPLLERMAQRQPTYDLTDEPQAFLEAIGELGDGDPAAALERVRATEPFLALMLEPMLGVSLAPTRISASQKINVIPSEAVLEVDCRVPPGLGEEHTLGRVREVLGDDGYALEFIEKVVGNRSPFQTPFAREIEGWVAEHDPEAICVPWVLPGFTDSRTFRAAFPECVAYGFFPHREMTMFEVGPLIHGADERIAVADLEYATEFFADIVRRVLG